MIRVTFESVPEGNERAKAPIAVVEIANVAGDERWADYVVALTESAGGPPLRTSVEAHHRPAGWLVLASRALERLVRANGGGRWPVNLPIFPEGVRCETCLHWQTQVSLQAPERITWEVDPDAKRVLRCRCLRLVRGRVDSVVIDGIGDDAGRPMRGPRPFTVANFACNLWEPKP